MPASHYIRSQTSSETWNWRLNCSALGHPAPGPVTSSLGQAPRRCSVCWLLSYVCQVQQTRVISHISACWPILQRADCQGVQLYNTDYRRMRSNRSQKFVVLWLKITFDITLSQLKFINLHNAVTYRFWRYSLFRGLKFWILGILGGTAHKKGEETLGTYVPLCKISWQSVTPLPRYLSPDKIHKYTATDILYRTPRRVTNVTGDRRTNRRTHRVKPPLLRAGA